MCRKGEVKQMQTIQAEEMLKERKRTRVRKRFVLRDYAKGTISFTLDASSEYRASVVSPPTF